MKTTDAFCFVRNLLFLRGETNAIAIGGDTTNTANEIPRITFPKDASPAEIIRTISHDVNLALDIYADAFDGSEKNVDRANEISDRCISEERKITEEEKTAIQTLLNLDALELSDKARIFMLRRVDAIRKTVNTGLIKIAIEETEKEAKLDDIMRMLSDLTQNGVPCNRFTSDAATDIDDIARKSWQAAAKTRNQLEAAAKSGRASARTRKDEADEDTTKNTIISEVNKRKRERDKNYPDRNSGGEKGPSDNQIYQTVANRHIGVNGKPIYTPTQIKEFFKPSKVKRRGGHKRE